MADPKPSTMIGETVGVKIVEPDHPYVGRGGMKLAAALDEFAIDVTGMRCLDAGASTGGFTDCLLQRGAVSVTAVDVGYGQLAWKLRSDPRVEVVERTNIRHADVEELGAPFDLVVADLSFISLRLVAPQLVGAARDDIVLLVKPQFEVGKDAVGRGGIVDDPELHRQSVVEVAAAYAALGRGLAGITPSPITGAKGNREFLIHLRVGGSGDERDIEAMTASVIGGDDS